MTRQSEGADGSRRKMISEILATRPSLWKFWNWNGQLDLNPLQHLQPVQLCEEWLNIWSCLRAECISWVMVVLITDCPSHLMRFRCEHVRMHDICDDTDCYEWCCCIESWVHCNDSMVTLCGSDDVHRCQAYILVYSRTWPAVAEDEMECNDGDTDDDSEDDSHILYSLPRKTPSS